LPESCVTIVGAGAPHKFRKCCTFVPTLCPQQGK
jgi:hypothetical protein